MKFVRVLVFSLLLAAAGVIADGLPDLGEAARSVFTPAQERALGEAIMADIRRDRSMVNDAELTGYLNNLGYRLVAASPDNRQDFEFFVIQDSTLNAFALPGGFIGVHTALIVASQSESELAAVLGHEIAHVTQRHLARMIVKEQQSALTSMAAIAVAILASRSNPQISNAAMAAAQASAIQTQLDFTREHEREADRIGLQILSQAGYDTRGMPTFFERLQRSNRFYENHTAPDYLRTHPVTSERIADIQNRLEKMPYRQVPDSLEFQLLRAKLRAADGKPKEAVALFEEALREKKYTSESAQRYGLAMALMRAGDFARAEKELSLLRKSVPSNAIVETLAGRIKVESGKMEEALAHYRNAIKRFPGHRALVHGYIETLLAAEQPVVAQSFTTDQLRVFPGDFRLYELQAQGYARQGNRLMSHQSQAEAYVLLGNLTAAIEQLQIALKFGGGDFYQLSIAEARLKQLRAQDMEARKN